MKTKYYYYYYQPIEIDESILDILEENIESKWECVLDDEYIRIDLLLSEHGNHILGIKEKQKQVKDY